jgi:hypothetical protein
LLGLVACSLGDRARDRATQGRRQQDRGADRAKPGRRWGKTGLETGQHRASSARVGAAHVVMMAGDIGAPMCASIAREADRQPQMRRCLSCAFRG